MTRLEHLHTWLSGYMTALAWRPDFDRQLWLDVQDQTAFGIKRQDLPVRKQLEKTITVLRDAAEHDPAYLQALNHVRTELRTAGSSESSRTDLNDGSHERISLRSRDDQR